MYSLVQNHKVKWGNSLLLLLHGCGHVMEREGPLLVSRSQMTKSTTWLSDCDEEVVQLCRVTSRYTTNSTDSEVPLTITRTLAYWRD